MLQILLILSHSIQTIQFAQKVDHFDYSNKESFTQYAYYDNDYIVDGKINSIIFTLIDSFKITSKNPFPQAVVDIAKQTNSLMLSLEMRYFENSIIGDTTDEENLVYLTIDQIHADIAQFLSIYENNNSLTDPRIVLVGSELSATILSWFRIKYPQYSVGLWSSFATTKIVFENNYTDPIILSRLDAISKDCKVRVLDIYDTFNSVIKNGDANKIKDLLNKFDMNIAEFFDKTDALYTWAQIFQILDDLPHNTKDSFQPLCDSVSDKDNYLDGFAKFFKATMNKKDISYLSLIPSNYNDKNTTSPYRSYRLLWYLKCNEIGNFHVENGLIFLQSSYYQNMCFYLFEKYSSNQINISRKRFDNAYLGNQVIFTRSKNNLNIDLMPSEDDPRNNIQVIELDGVQNSFDLINVSNSTSTIENDTISAVKNTVVQWIKNECPSRCQYGKCLLGKCICDHLYEGEFCQYRSTEPKNFTIISAVCTLLPTIITITFCSIGWFILLRAPITNFMSI